MTTKIKTLFGIIGLLLIISSFKLNTTNTTIDKNLVGIWKGFEIEKEIEGVEKHWIVQRFANGKYVIMFTAKQNCDIQTITEKGKWWTKGDKFYEQQDGNENVESYKYSIKDKIVVHFKSLTSDYEFDDFKIDD